MRTIFTRIMILSGMAALVIGLSGSVSPFSSSGASVYIDLDGTCQLFSPDEGLRSISNGSVSVITQNTYGNMVFRCRGQVSNSTGSSVKYDYGNTGALCYIPLNPDTWSFYPTYDWYETVSSSGNASLTCTYGRRSLDY